MASFVILGSYTEQGVQNIKDLPTRVAAVKEAISAAGGRMIAFYLTMGEYDFLSVVESPDDETAAQLLLQTNMQGNVRTKSLRAFTEDEAAAIVGRLS